MNDDTASRVKVCNIGNHTATQFKMPPVCGKERQVMFSLIKVMNLINPYLLSMQIITSFVNWRQPSNIRRYFFVYNGALDIARSVRNVSCSTLSRDVKLACNKH